MEWRDSSGGADTPAPPAREFRSRSKRRRKESSQPSRSTSAAWSESPGVFAVDKPAGLTSHDVVARVRRVLPDTKVGHAGTLDPDATGVLVICVGKATKVSSFLMEGEKEYEGVARLGATTDTQDASGQVLEERPVEVDADGLEAAVARFRGAIEQIPPMYSAVKIGGQKLYRLARKGVEVERPARAAFIYEFEILETSFPEFTFRVKCSKGTYVRTIVHDLGEALGCGGHLASLVRTQQAGFRRESAISLEQLQSEEGVQLVRSAKQTPEQALEFLPEERVRAGAEPIRNGGAIACGAVTPGQLYRFSVAGTTAGGVARASDEGGQVLHVFPSPAPRNSRRRDS